MTWLTWIEAQGQVRYPYELATKVAEKACHAAIAENQSDAIRTQARALYKDILAIRSAGPAAAKLYLTWVEQAKTQALSGQDSIMLTRLQTVCSFLEQDRTIPPELRHIARGCISQCEHAVRQMHLGKAHGAIKSALQTVAGYIRELQRLEDKN